MTDLATERVTVYICRCCKRPTTAPVRPIYHDRFIFAGEEVPEGVEVIRVEAALTDAHIGDPNDPALTAVKGFSSPGGMWVRCGPFEAYEVVKVP